MLATVWSLLGVSALAAVTAAPAAAQADRNPAGSTGSAFALSVTSTLLDAPLAKIAPRPLVVYPRGGSDSLAEVGPNAAGLVTANALTAAAALEGRTLASRASIADVAVKNILTASVIEADCTAGPGGVTGTSSVADLTVLGQRIAVDTPGEIDVLGIAKVRIGEQIRSGGTLTVNAVHVIVGGPVGPVASADIVLSQAKCRWVGGGTTSVPTTPSTTPTTTVTTTSTQPPRSETTTRPTSSTTTPRQTTEKHGVGRASNDDDLASTGVSGVLPISLAGLVLLAGGGAAVFVGRRRRAAKSDG